MRRVITISDMALRVGIVMTPLTCLAGVFLLTAGTDETWILFGVRGLIEHGRYAAESPFNGIVSTGGLHTALTALLHFIGGGKLEVIRLVSVVSVGILLVTLRFWALRKKITGQLCWLVTGAPLLVSGTFLLGSQAYGAILAFLLVTVGLMLWGELDPGTLRRRFLIGILLGTAVATRQNVVFALVAPLLVVLLSRSNRSQLVDSLFVLIIGGGIFVAQYSLLSFTSDNLIWNPESSGLVNPFSVPLGYWVPQKLSYWGIGQSIMPIIFPILISVCWFQSRQLVDCPHGIDALLIFAWLAILAWLFTTPIPHLRYLWPALAAFSITGLFALAVLLKKYDVNNGYAAVIGIAILATGYLDGARIYLHGESDILSWQLSRETRFSLDYGPFRQRQFQQSVVNQLLDLPISDEIATIGFDTSLSFLTRRNLVPVQTYYVEEGFDSNEFIFWRPERGAPSIRPRWLVSTPMIHNYQGARIGYKLYDWLERNCRVIFRQGPYVLYEVDGSYPATPDIFSY